ncbi:MAG: HAMP domain-containing histidine kinase [Bacteroidaceae bacterium]|nr:HAMP domain-containing histidine kinase [Bacteroidaceae bacterium]
MSLPFNYRLRFLLMALLFMALGGVAVWGLLQEWLPTHTELVSVVAILLALMLLRLVNRLPNQVIHFVKSLLSHNYTMHFPKTGDSKLDEMYNGMNRITAQFRDNMADLEYKQLYYDRLLRIMTHELRNSITPVISLSSDMLKRPENYTPDEMQESLEVIHDQCTSVNAFLDSYRQLTHLPAPEKKEVEVEKLFTQLQKLLAHPSLHFTWGNGMKVTADADQLTLVLTNLIKNAREATAGLPDACIHIVASEADGSPYIAVSDNGPGIPEEMTEEVFLPFYTTKQSGTGIGLCLSRQIMRLHGGDLKLMPQHGHGATFMVML